MRNLSLSFAIPLLVTSMALSAPPVTPKRPVTDTYHGTEVVDDYRWLENDSAPEVKAWSDAQNAAARAFLDGRPQAAGLRKRLTEILEAKTIGYSALQHRGGTLFAIKRQPPKQQPFLVAIDDLDKPASERILVDPTVIDAAGTTAIDWYEPSPDGKLVAVSLSHGGTEIGDIHFYDAATGREVHEVLPRVSTGTAGGDLAWQPDGSGVFYTRHRPVAGEPADSLKLRQEGYFHRFGTPLESDRYELGKDFPNVAEIEFEMQPSTGRLLATVQNGDGGEFAHFFRAPDGGWTPISGFADRIVQATFGPGDEIFLISRAEAPRGKILKVTADRLAPSEGTVIIPEGAETIVNTFYHRPTSLLATATRLYVLYQTGGPTELRVFDHSGKPLAAPKQLPVSSVGGLARLASRDSAADAGNDILFSNTSFLEPSAVYQFRAATGTTEKTWLATQATVDFADIDVVREFAVSRDGTKVPLTLLMRKGTRRDGTNPTLVTGYGGYGSSVTPRFSPAHRVLFDHGVIFVDTNIRGGGEFGETWHLEGNLTHKQNVFDDFAAVLRHVVERGYTSPAKLAITGGSNGGLLMGATFTQHPELVRAVVSHVGIYDMLRVELSPNGIFNITEFGTVANPEQFRALHAYSPFHHVRDGQSYPAILFLTGANDPRVEPMQSRKMTARLQASGATEPVLLRTSANSGHGGDTALSEAIEQAVDVYAFLFDRLGIEFRK